MEEGVIDGRNMGFPSPCVIVTRGAAAAGDVLSCLAQMSGCEQCFHTPFSFMTTHLQIYYISSIRTNVLVHVNAQVKKLR